MSIAIVYNSVSSILSNKQKCPSALNQSITSVIDKTMSIDSEGSSKHTHNLNASFQLDRIGLLLCY